MGRGPPYERRQTKRVELMEMNPSPNASGGGGSGGWGGGGIVRNAGGTVDAWQAKQKEKEDEKRYVHVVKYDQGFVPWAMNILATEEDLRVGMERVGLHGEINVAGTGREKVRDGQGQDKQQ
jgi:hypothetical protein